MNIMRRLRAFRASDWLSLAAAPTFALMAVVTGILDSGAHEKWCSTAMQMSPLTGMVPMYVLMSAFHFTPWLRLISSNIAQVRTDDFRERLHIVESLVND
jgi:ABC-type dipeptide/oligopeptide/nickel transport system permease subunit